MVATSLSVDMCIGMREDVWGGIRTDTWMAIRTHPGGAKAVNITGLGDWDGCYEFVKREVLHLDWECLFGTDCAFMARYFPGVPAKKRFYAVNAYFYTMYVVVPAPRVSAPFCSSIYSSTDACVQSVAINARPPV